MFAIFAALVAGHERAPSCWRALARRLIRILIVAGAARGTSLPLFAAPPLAFRIDEGRNINFFVRSGPVAAHLLLRSGADPRILVAFPAGNSGVGLWFARRPEPVVWTLDRPPEPVTLPDAQGRPRYGIAAGVRVDAASLDVRQAVLSSVRVLRDFEALRKAPDPVLTKPSIAGSTITWERNRLDGAAGYLLSITALDGAAASVTGFSAGRNSRLHLRILAASGDPPLHPLGGTALLTNAARPDERARNALAFLSYREKFLAGSWRFNTYFGRDTLMSVRLLMPVLQPEAVQAGLGAVLARLSPGGEVAHEEDIGEFAVLRNRKEGRGSVAAPIYDYGMIDGKFMLAPVAAAWLFDSDRGRARAAAFLAGAGEAGARRGEALVRNFLAVVESTRAFSADPRPANLVSIKAGRTTGNWRDSGEGLGRGRYPYDVNAVFVPAALAAIGRFASSGLLDPFLNADQRHTLATAPAQAAIWASKAPPLFTVTLPADQARHDVAAYAKAVGVPAESALAALSPDSLSFNALSLASDGTPVPVLHSDDGFALLFGNPEPATLERSVAAMLRPFPAGLLTPVGLVVANPAFAGAEAQSRFGNNAYHGTVVWSWQQAVLAAGLDRQIARADLPAPLRARLIGWRAALWAAIEHAGAVRTSELWSWSYGNGAYHVEPFGKRGADADESNAAQLWSTVFLALTPRP